MVPRIRRLETQVFIYADVSENDRGQFFPKRVVPYQPRPSTERGTSRTCHLKGRRPGPLRMRFQLRRQAGP